MPTSVFVSKFQTFLTLFYLSTLSTWFSLKVLEEIVKKKRYVICLPFSFTGLQENCNNQSKKYSLYSHQKPIQCPFGLMEILRFIVLAIFKHNYRWIGNCNQSYMLQRNFFRPNNKKKKQLWKPLSVIALSSFLMVAISLKEIHAHWFLQCWFIQNFGSKNLHREGNTLFCLGI